MAEIIRRGAPLAEYTRFGVGGPADLLVDAALEDDFVRVATELRAAGTPTLVIGGGTNLVVSDDGFRGAVLRFTGAQICGDDHVVTAQSGAELQALVDYTVERGLTGIHTMTGVPGWVGGAVYGNAGAYGTSIDGAVETVRFFDGESIRTFANPECRFAYRESIFKRHRGWTILSATFRMGEGDADELKTRASEILSIRNAKYPPSMKCAGSIFKNLIHAQLPAEVQAQVPAHMIKGGKVPSAWFLEQAGVKGMRHGGIVVADYHANLIYNEGTGTAAQICEVIAELKARVRRRFGFEVEEEVQYVGF